MNFSTYHHLEAYYSSKILQLAKKIGKKATVWQGNFLNEFESNKCKSF